MKTLQTAVLDGVLRVELDRPERLNAMNRRLLEELTEVFEGCTQGAVLLSGRGRGFCSGADLREISFDEESVRSLMLTVQRLVLAMDSSSAAIVVHVHGLAIGGGCCLAALGDLVYADADTTFAVNQASRGLVPDMGIMWLLPRLVGAVRARRLLLLGDSFSTAEAVEIGLVTGIGSREEALTIAGRLAANAEAVALTKEGIRRGRQGHLAESLAYEIEAEVRAFQTERVQSSIREFVRG